MDPKILEKFQKELLKNKSDLEKSKIDVIDELKKWKKEDIFNKENTSEKNEGNYTLWTRIKRVLGF